MMSFIATVYGMYGNKFEFLLLIDMRYKMSGIFIMMSSSNSWVPKSGRARIYLDRTRLPGFTHYALFSHYAFIAALGLKKEFTLLLLYHCYYKHMTVNRMIYKCLKGL